MIAAEKTVNEARQSALEDTSICADAEVLVQALRLPTQQQALDSNALEALARMTEALTRMRVRQQAQRQAAPATRR